MKAANLFFKLAAIVLAASAVIFCILANIDKIHAWMLNVREHCSLRRNACCNYDNMDEYEDWDV